MRRETSPGLDLWVLGHSCGWAGQRVWLGKCRVGAAGECSEVPVSTLIQVCMMFYSHLYPTAWCPAGHKRVCRSGRHGLSKGCLTPSSALDASQTFPFYSFLFTALRGRLYVSHLKMGNKLRGVKYCVRDEVKPHVRV